MSNQFIHSKFSLFRNSKNGRDSSIQKLHRKPNFQFFFIQGNWFGQRFWRKVFNWTMQPLFWLQRRRWIWWFSSFMRFRLQTCSIRLHENWLHRFSEFYYLLLVNLIPGDGNLSVGLLRKCRKEGKRNPPELESWIFLNFRVKIEVWK